MRGRTRTSSSLSAIARERFENDTMDYSSQPLKRVALSEKPIQENKLKSSVASLRNSQQDKNHSSVIFGDSSQTAGSASLKRHIYRDEECDLEGSQDAGVRTGSTGSAGSIEPERSHKRLKCETLERRREELDSQDAEDVTMCYDYSDDIFDHLYKRQFETTPEINYLSDKNYEFYLRPTMRSILVDWLIEVHCKFQLLPETLYLAINLMDRYLSFNKVTLPRLQLIAITSLLIAAKFEEVNLPKLSNYSYITDNAYSNEEIKQAEFVILNKLEYNIGWPNPLNFLRRISRCDEYDSITRTIGKCLLEYTVSCPHFIDMVPSKIASVAMFTAQQIVHEDFQWNELWDYYSCDSFKGNEMELKKFSKLLTDDIAKPSTQLNALIYKYKKIGTWNKIHEWCLMNSTSEELNSSDHASSSPASSSSL